MNGAPSSYQDGDLCHWPWVVQLQFLGNDVRAIHDDISYRSVSLSFSIALRNNIPSNSAK